VNCKQQAIHPYNINRQLKVPRLDYEYIINQDDECLVLEKHTLLPLNH
jgi:hypothetical protein